MTHWRAAAPLKFPVLPELDGVRALAVLIVFLSHLSLGKYIPGGLGVTIFFFLSGYLITSLLRAEASQTGRISLPGFYGRRTLRIFPPLYITLLIIGLMVAIRVLPAAPDAGSVWAQLLFLSNYAKLFGADHGLPGPPLWSLAVEEHYYLLFPWFFAFVLMRCTPTRAALICGLGCLVPLALRIVQARYPGGLELNYFLSHTRVDSILFGSVLALWQNPIFDGPRSWRPRGWQVAAAATLVIGAAGVRNAYFGDTFRYTLQGIGLFALFSWVLHGNRAASWFLMRPAMQLIGRYSYTLYLVHNLVILTLVAHMPHVPMALIGIATAVLSMLYAAAMYVLVERPLARLRKRLHHEAAGGSPTKAEAGALAPDAPTSLAATGVSSGRSSA